MQVQAQPLPRSQRPRIVELPDQLMAVVRTVGDPNVVGKDAIGALYGTVYTLKFARKRAGTLPDFKVGALRARWPNSDSAPKDAWEGAWALPVPDDTESLPQKSPDVPVSLERWQYGTVAQVLHVGPYAEEQPAIERLHAFIAEQGFRVAGPHEEEYLTSPAASVQKTIIRYRVTAGSNRPAE